MGLVACALIINIALLMPVLSGLLGRAGHMDAAFGPKTPARGILTSVYLAIAILSVIGLGALIWMGASALPYIIGLLAMQVLYKLITVWAVGLGNPVVVANLAIAAFHIVAISVALRR